MKFEGKNLIGLDIGTAFVKVVQLKESSKGLHLQKFGMEPLPPQTIVDGNIMNSDSVVEAEQKLFRDLGIRQKEVSLSISGHSVIIKKLSLPLMRAEELEDQIPWEAEQHIPFEINDVEIDYEVLQKHDDLGQMDVLLVAAKKTEISDYAQITREAKLKPLVVDIDAFALQNAYEVNYGITPGEIIALLNIGASLTTLNIIKGGATVFTRDIANGGNSITEEIQKQLNVSYEQAETYKTGGEIDSTEVVPEEVDAIVEQVVESLAGEIQRSLDFYMATTSGEDISRIFVSGGTSKIALLVQAIERRARVPVEPMDPFRRLIIDERQFDPVFLRGMAAQAAVCIGLGLRKQREKIE